MTQTTLYGKHMAHFYTCLNGSIVLAHRAALPVTDRGFRFGDGVFETIRLEAAVPYQWDLHMARLSQGLAALRIKTEAIDWAFHARKLIQKNKATTGFLRLSVSRGSGSRGYLPHPPNMPISWIIEYLPPLDMPQAPFQLWLSNTARIPLQSLPMNQTLAQGVGSTLALMEAHDNQCEEALQLSTTGFLCETASANLFWIKDEVIFAPSLDCGCLNGTTRDAVLRLAPIPTRMTQAGLHDLRDADAVFISNSRLGVWPISQLRPMGWAFKTNHPIVKKLQDLLQRDRARDAAQNQAFWSGK